MNCIITERPSFQILAASREFHEKTAMTDIPKYWDEYFAKGYGKIACGQYGICYGSDGTGKLRYAIGNACEVETCADGSKIYHVFNCPDRTEIPEGFELLTTPEAVWASFESIGPLPQSIQNLWRRVYSEWLPQSGYDKDFSFDLEEYERAETPEDLQRADYRCYLRIPVKKSDCGGFAAPPAHIHFLAKKYPELTGMFQGGALAYVEPGGGGPLEKHTHPYDHLFLVLRGEARIEFENETVIVKTNGIRRVSGSRPHAVWNNSETTAVMLGLTITGERNKI